MRPSLVSKTDDEVCRSLSRLSISPMVQQAFVLKCGFSRIRAAGIADDKSVSDCDWVRKCSNITENPSFFNLAVTI